jgi:hypothetical protein
VTRQKKVGRPPRRQGEILSKNRTFRVRGDLDKKLQDAAAKGGRSVSETIERVLEDWFFQERLNAGILGSDAASEILRLIRAAMVVEGLRPDWSGDPVRAENFRVVSNAIIAVITGLPLDLPPPDKRAEALQTAKTLLLSSPVRRKLPNEIMFSDLEPLDFGERKNDDG